MPAICGSLGSESPPVPVTTMSAVTSPWSVLTCQTLVLLVPDEVLHGDAEAEAVEHARTRSAVRSR